MTTTAAPSAPSTSTFEPQLDMSLIDAHPHNVRRRAVADDELVGSIKASGLVQPVIVAPSTIEPGRYVLIAGHRRLDGCRKARRKTVPAVIRADLVTEGQQVEAMLIENGRRLDLSPMEEAEGYQQLTLFGYKQKDIAAAVGHDQKTVASRMRLLKLQKSTQKKVHDGQLTLTDALAIASFADDPDTTKKLEKAAADGQLKWALERAQNTRKNQKKARELAQTHIDAGIPELDNPKGLDTWALKRDGIAHSLSWTHSDKPEDHNGCLRFVVIADAWTCRVELVCVTPDAHAEQADDAEADRQAEHAKFIAKREARAAEEAAAAAARADTLLSAMTSQGMLVDLLEVLVPHLLWEFDGNDLQTYFDIIGIPDEGRWPIWGGQRDDAAIAKFNAHIEAIEAGHITGLYKAVAAMFTAAGEQNLFASGSYLRPQAETMANRYLNHLEQLGHEFSPIDLEARAIANGEDDES